MKKMLLLLALFVALPGGLYAASGQNLSPQPNFSTQVLSSNPLLYLNFNDPNTSFRDQISQDAFLNTATASTTTTIGSLPTELTTSTGNVYFANTALASGSLTSFQLLYNAAPTAGPVTMVIGTISGSNITITNSFTVNVAATTSAQTFTAGVNYTAVPVTSGQLIGIWGKNNSAQVGFNGSGGPGLWYLPASGSLPVDSNTYTLLTNYLIAIKATVTTTTTYTSGTVIPHQPGFDSTQVNNTSAEFPYNGFNLAPNNTLGAIDWNTPWTMMFHVDRLNWDRTGVLVLASKGDISSSSNSYWELYLQMSGNYSQLCFMANVPNSTGPAIQGGICTTAPLNGVDVMPNGFNYNIIISNAATGAPGIAGGTNTFTMYLNGLEIGGIGNYIGSKNIGSGDGFGAVSATVTGGTGYANTTYFTSTGGGSNCVANGYMTSVSGVPTSVTVGSASYLNYGCTSAPTLVLTSPTGTGAVLTATPMTPMSFNATTYPLMVPGYVSGGAYYGIDSSDSTQTPTYIDEFAIFPTVLNFTQVSAIYYQTKFYQGLLKALPATPYTLVYDDDSCSDEDNIFALALAIGADKIGYIRLAGVVDSGGDGVSEAIYRQMLDQAGLANIPMAVPSVFGTSTSGGWCSAANVNTYNASTPQTTSLYPQAKTMYRQIFANNPTTPVFIMLGGSFRGVADLMQSPADSISSLTGAQLIARNAANGGAIYAQGLAANESFTGDNSLEDWTAGQYVVENNGTMPIYWYGGVPQSTGPGALSTRTSKDPLFLAATAAGSDVRQAYDSLPTQSFLSNLFAGGVGIAISGSGTGYAAQTAFTSTGGGASCSVTGFVLSTNGVPSSIISTGGVPLSNVAYEGIGSGCFTASNPPTIVLTNPTGTGAVLTATTTASPCGTVTITASNAGSTSTATCSNHYFLPMSVNAVAGTGYLPVMQWFLNSLVDPVPSGVPRRNE